MIGSDLEGADPESRVASWAASATSDDAAAACGDRGLWRPAGGGRCGRRRKPARWQRRRHAARTRNRRRESAAYGHIRRRFGEHAPGLYVPIRRHHRQRRPRGSQGNKPGDDHDPRYRRDATGASPAAVRSGTRGGHCKITQSMYQQMPEQSGGGCSVIWRVRHPDSGTFRIRIRLRSPSTTQRRRSR